MADDGLLTRILRGGFRPQKTRLQIDWMTHTDERIMEHLRAVGPATPDEIAAALEKSVEYVADRCRMLALRRLLEQRDDGDLRYGLTDRGGQYLDDELDAEDLTDER